MITKDQIAFDLAELARLNGIPSTQHMRQAAGKEPNEALPYLKLALVEVEAVSTRLRNIIRRINTP